MREMMVASMNSAVENNEEIMLSLETTGFNAMSVVVVPDHVEIGDDNLVIFSDKNIITLDTESVEWDAAEEKYICLSENSVVSVSF